MGGEGIFIKIFGKIYSVSFLYTGVGCEKGGGYFIKIFGRIYSVSFFKF